MLFSIITITRDNLEGLKRTQDSLHWQVCRDFEWIVIDGASKDGTRQYLETTTAHWYSEKDSGIYDAMNKGIIHAAGNYLLFLNAGDTLAAPDTLERVKKAMVSAPDFIYGDSIEADNHKTARHHSGILNGMFTHHQSMFYNRHLLGPLRYDISYRIAADYKFTLAFLKKAAVILYCPFPVCIFEQGGVSQTQVSHGRIEQFRARRELEACHPIRNFAIYGLQSAIMVLRRVSPGLYWFLRNLRLNQ
jgi:putative colanic acid biosynthesis glycosyltransferase